MSDEFPKMVYAQDGDTEVWGRNLRTLIVNDEDEELVAIEEGFVAHPHDLQDTAPEFVGERSPDAMSDVPEKRGPGRPRKEVPQ